MAWAQTLLSVVVVSLASLVGLVSLSLDEQRLQRLSNAFVGFAVGAMLGDTFLHLMPEAFSGTARLRPSVMMLAGLLVFFLVEKLLRHEHGPLHRREHPQGVAKPELAAINLVGDGLHNFIDGVLIAASYLTSPALGIGTTIAVLLHELPQELGDFAVLLRSGLSVRQAALFNLLSASAALLGALLTLMLGEALGRQLTQALIPCTAGGFLYIATATLIPELQHDRTLKGFLVQAGMISLGLAVMGALLWME